MQFVEVTFKHRSNEYRGFKKYYVCSYFFIYFSFYIFLCKPRVDFVLSLKNLILNELMWTYVFKFVF